MKRTMKMVYGVVLCTTVGAAMGMDNVLEERVRSEKLFTAYDVVNAIRDPNNLDFNKPWDLFNGEIVYQRYYPSTAPLKDYADLVSESSLSNTLAVLNTLIEEVKRQGYPTHVSERNRQQWLETLFADEKNQRYMTVPLMCELLDYVRKKQKSG